MEEPLTMSARDPGEGYRRDRVTAEERFDEVEATVSHLLRWAHPGLGGKSFGGALYQGLTERGLLEARAVFELGGGLGDLASELCRAAGGPLRYTFLELSPRLARAQRAKVPHAESVGAHAERLPFRDASLRGLFLSNEVIADLRVVEAGSREGEALRARYALDVARGQLINAGAMRLLEELRRVLAPGAATCLTEFGGDFPPRAVRLEGPGGRGRHHEHSIHFGQLEQVARALGFSTERVPLHVLVGADPALRVASYLDLLRLRRFVPSLPVFAFPGSELQRRHPVLTRLFRFDFPPLGSPRFPEPQATGGFFQLFHALILRVG